MTNQRKQQCSAESAIITWLLTSLHEAFPEEFSSVLEDLGYVEEKPEGEDSPVVEALDEEDDDITEADEETPLAEEDGLEVEVEEEDDEYLDDEFGFEDEEDEEDGDDDTDSCESTGTADTYEEA